MPIGFDRLCDPFRRDAASDDVTKDVRPRSPRCRRELIQSRDDVVWQPARHCFAHVYAIVCKRI